MRCLVRTAISGGDGADVVGMEEFEFAGLWSRLGSHAPNSRSLRGHFEHDVMYRRSREYKVLRFQLVNYAFECVSSAQVPPQDRPLCTDGRADCQIEAANVQ